MHYLHTLKFAENSSGCLFQEIIWTFWKMKVKTDLFKKVTGWEKPQKTFSASKWGRKSSLCIYHTYMIYLQAAVNCDVIILTDNAAVEAFKC